MSDAEKSFVRRVWGRTCLQIQVQQYYYNGVLKAEWNVFWLLLDDDAWVKFCFDAGVFSWKPEPPALPKSSQLRVYKLVEPSIAPRIARKQILAANFGPLRGGGRVLGLWFEGGLGLYIRNRNDQTSIVVG
ncbi:MAG TPA: hypothetical protein VGD45_23420 [Steroidobacter sp.]|uniref:hypothetical protein n=1 Tax=Steroidobacter sp. TaxID=1978227 RepID=UPI002ED80A1E